MTKTIKRFRIGQILIEEKEVNGSRIVYYDGKVYGGTFREAIVEAKQAPLVEMRDECHRLAARCRNVRLRRKLKEQKEE